MNAGAYKVCAIRSVPDQDETSVLDSTFAAVPGTSRDQVRLEPSDGDDITHFSARGITVINGATRETVTHVEKSGMSVSFTASRFTIGCSKYDTGGQWIGGLSALAIEAGERAVSAARRRNKMLVGLVRYPWIAYVSARNKAGWNKPPVLSLVVSSSQRSTEHQFVIKLVLDKHADAIELGTDLVRRTSQFRLKHDPSAAGQYQDEFEQLARLTTLPDPAANGALSVSLRHHFVSQQSADIGRTG